MRTGPSEIRRRERRPGPLASAITGATLGAHAVLAVAQPEEIVVTARKLPEMLGAVPLKIDSETDDGGELGVESLQNLVGRVPGLYFESGWGGLFSAPTLRAQQASPAGDVNVGVFVDGVYQANPTAIDMGPIDVERVEVVRGPQSALFGHSTFAGAIHFVSHAPSPTFDSGVALEAGSDGYAGAGGFVSGPLASGALLGRLAVGTRAFDGTHDNVAADGQPFGGLRRQSIALQLVTPARDGFEATVSARFSETRSGQPAVASLTYEDYNCGAIEPASGAWSYYCGDLPLATRFDGSVGIPDSDDEVGQLALTLAWPIATGTLTSVTTYYRGATDVYRDFDASSAGQLFGVCTVGTSCTAASGPWPIDRLTRVDQVWREIDNVEEWNQELRWSGGYGPGLQWSLGAAAWRTSERVEALLGGERGNVAATERLTAILPQSPGIAGPQSLVNLALVTDPNAQQATQSLDVEERRTLAFFGTLDLSFGSHWRARLEARTTHEERELDNRVANFAPGFGTAISSLSFRDVTPRVSVQYSPASSWSAYASAAKGSQSGGINAIPGLLPAEQGYAPEFNWTYELAARYRPDHGTFGFDATVFHIDWSDTQILGFGQSPNLSNLITLNTAGIRTNGVELSLQARPVPSVLTELDLSWTDPEFRAGSDDPGSRRFCGLSGGNTTSTFCAVGPSRTGASLLVPYIDGNVPARVPRRTWHAGLAVTPRIEAGRLLLRLDAYGQDDVFDRAINGARFGGRTLVDMRLSYDFGSWSIALWGRNLGDERYVRALASRGQIYFPTSPRPLDALYGEGRRFGLSVTFSPSLGQRRSNVRDTPTTAAGV